MILPYIPKPIIYKNIISNIIAPHGITDVIHSIQYNTTNELLLLNTGITSTTCLLSIFDYPYILDSLFIGTSILHFSHDFSFKNKQINILISTLLLFISIFYNYDIFFIYMIFWHVPKHYKTNFKYLKQNKIESILLLLFTTLFMNIFINKISNILLFTYIFDISKGIIISHILYEEKYIYNDL